MRRWVTNLAVILSLVLVGCKGGNPDAGEPRRPKSSKKKKILKRTDCKPLAKQNPPPALLYRQRRVHESANLARQGVARLMEAARASDPQTVELSTMDAVDLLITALAADPYNVHATYNLAAAYASIRRAQCSVNLLQRLLQMRNLRSKRDDVKEKFDRLLGRNGKRLDPDFGPIRDNKKFRTFARNI